MNKLAHSIQQSNTGDSVARRRFTHTLLGLVLFSTLSIALAQSQQFEEDFDDENKPWEEIAIQLPAAPKAENLLPFYVSPYSNTMLSR
jgi:hypothetical protein